MRRTNVCLLGLVALSTACASDPIPTFTDEDAAVKDVPDDSAPALDAAPDLAPAPDAASDAAPDRAFDVVADRTGPDALSDAAADASADRGGMDAPGDEGGADVGCPAVRTLCGGACVDPLTDAMHCGACGRACAAGERCADGVCGGASETTWGTNATDHECAAPGVVGMRFTYRCPPGGGAASVWGTGVYTHDSSICAAAVHAGRITAAAGGVVTIEMRAGREAYTASMRNGVSSNAYGAWRCSFAVVATACAAPSVACEDVCAEVASDPLHCGRCGASCGATNRCVAGACACESGMTSCGGACVDTATDAAHCGRCGMACPAGQVCAGGACGATPILWSASATDRDCAAPGVVGTRFTHRCPPGGTAGSVWGTDAYTHDSSICTAAVHVGRITLAAGGNVTIEMAPGRDRYVGSARNGVTSNDYGAWGCSFVFP